MKTKRERFADTVLDVSILLDGNLFLSPSRHELFTSRFYPLYDIANTARISDANGSGGFFVTRKETTERRFAVAWICQTAYVDAEEAKVILELLEKTDPKIYGKKDKK